MLFSSASAQTNTLININNWSAWLRLDGNNGNDPITGLAGFHYPRGYSGLQTIWGDQTAWVGYLRDGSAKELRKGQLIRTNPGWVESAGVPADPNDPRVRVYRIRNDFATITADQVRSDAGELNGVSIGNTTPAMIQETLDQYETDWKEWPTDLGAPYYDVNDNGVYDPVLDAEGRPDPTQGDYPGIADADQVAFVVYNDLDETEILSRYDCPVMGLEIQLTYWAYNQTESALGQIVFKRVRFINKTGYDIDSLYISNENDPDLGAAGDDLCGIDTTRQLAFIWNAFAVDEDYAELGLPAACFGWDLFQGPMVETGNPADTAVFNFEYYPGYKNQPISCLIMFAPGIIYRHADGVWSGYDRVKGNFVWAQGYSMLSIDPKVKFVAGSGPLAGQPVDMWLTGDPVTGEGDIDGQGTNPGPGDRRLGLWTGPCSIKDGEFNEIVLGLVGSGFPPNATNRECVAAMYANSDVAQKAYDSRFQAIPKPPEPPQVSVTTVDGTILLDWSWDELSILKTEAFNASTGYDFEGYNVYQLPSASAQPSEAVKIATFDKVNGVTEIRGKRFLPGVGQAELPIQTGTDNGVQRYLTIDKDYLTEGQLFEGSQYFFSVTAYNHNAEPPLIDDKAIESSLYPLIVVTLQGTKPGTRYEASIGDTTVVEHTAGEANTLLGVTVIDPAKGTGDTYEVFMTADEDGAPEWNVRNLTSGDVIVEGKSVTDHTAIVDGLEVTFDDPGFQIATEYTSGTASPLYPGYSGGMPLAEYMDPWGSDFTRIQMGFYNAYGLLPSAYHVKPIRIDFAPMTAYTDWNGNGAYDSGEPFEIDSTNLGQKASWYESWSVDNWKGAQYVPYKAYDISDPANPRQLSVFYRIRNLPFDTWKLGYPTYDNERLPAYGGDTITVNSGAHYDVITADDYDGTGLLYSPDERNIMQDGFGNVQSYLPAYYTISFRPHPDNPMLAEGGSLTIMPVGLTLDDKWQFTAPAVVESKAYAQADVEKINVFPNPYYAGNTQEVQRNDHFVTFNHLPERADIYIFTLSGTLVKKIEKNSTEQFYRWNLKNESNIPVASGIYFVHVEMPELDKTKNLKMFIVQPDQILKRF
jgi:hypothetical protein